MRPSLLFPLYLVSLALAKAIPDIEPFEYTPKATKTRTCECAKITPRPESVKRSDNSSYHCLTNDVVDDIIDGYTYILSQPGENPEQFNVTVLKWLADDFKVYSDSILTLSNRAVGKGIPAYPSRDALLASQFNKGIAIPIIKTTDVFFACRKIAWRWTAKGLGKDLFPVSGMMTFEVVYADDEGFTAAQPAEPASVEMPSTKAESTMGSPSNMASASGYEAMSADMTEIAGTAASTTTATPPTASRSDGDTPGCAPGNSPDGDPSAGDCPPRKTRAKRDGQGGQWKVRTVYSEFNTAAWIKDVGGECAMPAVG